MIDWNLAATIFVFGSLAVLIAAIYTFGRILRKIEKPQG